jgi:hypothetical protein
VMADKKRATALQLLQDVHGLLGKSYFNPAGCDALLTCADQVLVSTEDHLE